MAVVDDRKLLLSDRANDDLSKKALELYKTTEGSKREGATLRILVNGCEDRKGLRGYVAELAPTDNILHDLAMDKEFCMVEIQFKLGCSEQYVRQLSKEIDRLKTLLIKDVEGAYEGGLEDVTDPLDCASEWKPTLSNDSPSTMFTLGKKSIKRGKEYYLTIRTNLKCAVKNLMRKYRKTATSVASFCDSQDFIALKAYTILNVCRFMSKLSDTFHLDCKKELKRGLYNDSYADCCTPNSLPIFYNIIERSPNNKDVYVMYHHAFSAYTVNLGGGFLVVQGLPAGEFYVWEPPANTKFSSSVAHTPIPVDLGMVSLNKRLSLSYKEKFPNTILSNDDYGYTGFVMREDQLHDIPDEAFEKAMVHYGINNKVMTRSTIKTIVAFVSDIKPRHVPIDYIESYCNAKEMPHVLVPMDHKFFAFATKVYAKYDRLEGSNLPRFNEIFVQSQTQPSVFEVPNAHFLKIKAIVFKNPKYARVLSNCYHF